MRVLRDNATTLYYCTRLHFTGVIDRMALQATGQNSY